MRVIQPGAHWVASALSLALFAGEAARADRITLQDGSQLDGRTLLEAGRLVHLDTDQGLFVVARGEIRKREGVEAAAEPGAQATLYGRIRAIRAKHFDRDKGSDIEQRIADGRQQILAIDDPAAVVPLAKVLIEGKPAAREVLVEALSRHDTRDATLILTSLLLIDEVEGVRRAAAAVLHERKDSEVVENLRRALKSDDEQIIRNAAVALGLVDAREAVPDLIAALDMRKRGRVPLTPRPRRSPRMERILHERAFKDSALVPDPFGEGEPVYRERAKDISSFRNPIRDDWVSVSTPRSGKVPIYRARLLASSTALRRSGDCPPHQDTEMSLYRTEAQEALIRITGENYGFDVERWQKWLAENPPSTAPSAAAVATSPEP